MTKYPLYKKLSPGLTVNILGIQICSEKKPEVGLGGIGSDDQRSVSPAKKLGPGLTGHTGHSGHLPAAAQLGHMTGAGGLHNVQSLLHSHHGHNIPGNCHYTTFIFINVSLLALFIIYC